MLEIEKRFEVTNLFPYKILQDRGKVLYFDIETTGLSPSDSEIYLIGAVYEKEDGYYFRQWFSESMSDEEQLLLSFDRFIEDYDTLITFNGDHFDIRFIEETSRSYHIPCHLREKTSIDLYKLARKVKEPLKWDSCKQKTVECFLGVDREDVFSGGELIEVYGEYRRTKDKRLLHALLQHNEDDLKGMPRITPILSYVELLSGDFDLTVNESYRSKSGEKLTVNFSVPFRFLTEAEITLGSAKATLKETEVTVEIPIFIGELRSYLPHPENYWYLPEENMVVHKRLASQVDASHRVKATGETCFVKSVGEFAELPKDLPLPTFRKAYRDKIKYVKISDVPLEDYLHALFSVISI